MSEVAFLWANASEGIYGSAQEFDEVPNWRGFRNSGLQLEVGGLGDWDLSAANGQATYGNRGLVRLKPSFP
jgi:hypothetical protein